MREVETLLFLKTLVVAAIDGGILETIASSREIVGDDTLLYDVCDIIHIINGDVALVLWIDPVKLFQRMDGNGIACSIFTCETAVGILDENGTLNLLLKNRPVDGFGLRLSGAFEDDYLCIGDSIDAELKLKAFGESILLIKMTQDGDVDMVEFGEIKTFECTNAVHHAILCNEKHAWDSGGILGFVGCNGHDE